MRYAVLGMLLLFALGDGCSPPPNVVGVQDFGHVTGRVLDAMTNRPIANALLSVGSLYTTRADVNGGFTLRAVAGDQTVTARAAGYATVTADTTITKNSTVSIGYIRLVPLIFPQGQPTLQPPTIPTPSASPSPAATAAPRPRRAHRQRAPPRLLNRPARSRSADRCDVNRAHIRRRQGRRCRPAWPIAEPSAPLRRGRGGPRPRPGRRPSRTVR